MFFVLHKVVLKIVILNRMSLMGFKTVLFLYLV